MIKYDPLKVNNEKESNIEELLEQILIELKTMNLFQLKDKTGMINTTLIEALIKIGKIKNGEYQL